MLTKKTNTFITVSVVQYSLSWSSQFQKFPWWKTTTTSCLWSRDFETFCVLSRFHSRQANKINNRNEYSGRLGFSKTLVHQGILGLFSVFTFFIGFVETSVVFMFSKVVKGIFRFLNNSGLFGKFSNFYGILVFCCLLWYSDDKMIILRLQSKSMHFHHWFQSMTQFFSVFLLFFILLLLFLLFLEFFVISCRLSSWFCVAIGFLIYSPVYYDYLSPYFFCLAWCFFLSSWSSLSLFTNNISREFFKYGFFENLRIKKTLHFCESNFELNRWLARIFSPLRSREIDFQLCFSKNPSFFSIFTFRKKHI